MAKIVIWADGGELVHVMGDDSTFGMSEVPPKFYRLQITDVTIEDIRTLMAGLTELVHYYDGETFIADVRWEMGFHKWYVDLTDVSQAWLDVLNNPDPEATPLQITASEARQAKILRNKDDGRVVGPQDFNTPDHTPHRSRDDDIRNIPGAPMPPELGGSQEVWDLFIQQIQEGMYGV